MAKRLFLVRHGATEWTAARRLQGQTDIPLSCEGRRQAQEISRHLSKVRFDSVYTSDLARALETAQAIAAGQSNSASLAVDSGLREISDGIYEGCSLDAVEPDPRMEPGVGGPTPVLDFAPPRGESIRQVFARQEEVAARLVADGTARKILVVGHDWALRLLAAALLDRGPEWFLRLEPLSPGSVSIMETRDGSASIELWNQTSHLSS